MHVWLWNQIRPLSIFRWTIYWKKLFNTPLNVVLWRRWCKPYEYFVVCCNYIVIKLHALNTWSNVNFSQFHISFSLISSPFVCYPNGNSWKLIFGMRLENPTFCSWSLLMMWLIKHSENFREWRDEIWSLEIKIWIPVSTYYIFLNQHMHHSQVMKRITKKFYL